MMRTSQLKLKQPYQDSTSNRYSQASYDVKLATFYPLKDSADTYDLRAFHKNYYREK